MSRAIFRRKSSAVSLRKSIESAIQWLLIHHGITFVTIHNPAVYLSDARVIISPTLVPRLLSLSRYMTATRVKLCEKHSVRDVVRSIYIAMYVRFQSINQSINQSII